MIEKRCPKCKEVLYPRETMVEMKRESPKGKSKILRIYSLHECLNCKKYFHKLEKSVESEELE